MIGPQKPCSGATYLKFVDDLKARFGEDSNPVHSFPELSLASWRHKAPEDVRSAPDKAAPDAIGDEEDAAVEPVQVTAPSEHYSVDDILQDGCFLERAEIERLLERLRTCFNGQNTPAPDRAAGRNRASLVPAPRRAAGVGFRQQAVTERRGRRQ